ncbi:putative acyltransferase (family 3), putative membrane protein [Bradyrhizobium sp. ORS 285]|uniref:acyltransferase family protein n=1 Tax=Bradyrhizobium sp. ORS 285 TaxID=115808 RepID=UPI0002406D68|nr:acyltransferase [Bradyrhizobium sp. ORS 285]CCD87237.1 putative acyltransferase (family 3), membrane protein [Bradyrhizobium sp. ORS 285]SMX58131.1 putative acyltransferase (family 3), putative membrane protein [Bradyrhizobium sp. ORS 285]
MNDQRFIGSLTGLRFIAAATVAIGHGAPSLGHGWPAELIAQVSSIGMTMFFVLSGFVLWLNYARRFQTQPVGDALREFAIARFARLYPMYAVVVLAIVTYLMIARGLSAPSLGFILTMTQAWFPVQNGTMLVAVVPALQHLWSISVELFFYLLFPFICFLLAGITRLSTVIWLAVANILAFALTIAAFFTFGPTVLQAVVPSLQHGGMQWLTYYAPYLHVAQFLAGCFAAMIYQNRALAEPGPAELQRVTWLVWLSLTGLACAPVLMFLQPRLPGLSFSIELAVRMIEISAFSILFVATSRYGRARWLSSRALIIGGECSYSIYLLHPFLIRLAMIGKSNQPGFVELVIRLALFVGIATAVALISYILIEARGRAWIRRALGSSAPREVIQAKVS